LADGTRKKSKVVKPMNDKIVSSEVYEKLGMQDLIVYAIYSVTKSGEVCTYERLIKECYEKFPKTFSLKNYPSWPDSLKLDRPLRTLRQKGFVIGSTRGNFELTRFGLDLAHDIESTLLGRARSSVTKRQGSTGRGIDIKIVQNLKQSNAFMRYRQDSENFSISETEFRSLLRCTLETPERVVKQNLEYYKNVAQVMVEKEVLQFLLTCENQLHKGGQKNG
jgi:hypothetical protein